MAGLLVVGRITLDTTYPINGRYLLQEVLLGPLDAKLRW